tara:strand:+ start:221 stop:469 length:249 start_codon:yes stop_codon:yes gene_type:complete
MQKIINVLAIASTAVSIAVVGSVGYVYVNREAITDSIKEKVLDSVGIGGLGGGLPIGTPDLSTPDNAAKAPSMGLPIPSSPF